MPIQHSKAGQLAKKRKTKDSSGLQSYVQSFLKDLFASEVPPKTVMGLKIVAEKCGEIGIVKGLYGNTGLLRVQFAPSVTRKKKLCVGGSVVLKLRRYVFGDRKKHLNQDWLDDVKVEFHPIKFGPIFAATGGVPPAKRSPQRQALRFQELRRWSARKDVPLNLRPKHFPVDETLAACCILALVESGASP